LLVLVDQGSWWIRFWKQKGGGDVERQLPQKVVKALRQAMEEATTAEQSGDNLFIC